MKASVYVATSLDGFIARENGDLDWLPSPQDDSNDFGFNEFFDSVETLIMGRHSFEKVLSFGHWPYGKKPVVVLSTKPVLIPDDLTETVESMSCSPIELVKQLSERGVEHLYVDGGKTIQGFLNAGLINQIIITRIPILLGQGIPLFGPLEADINLRHIHTQTFANGFVQSRYEVCG